MTNRAIPRLVLEIRRFFLLNFRKSYVRESLRKRKGTCPPDCGACCVSVRNRPCKYLDENKRCTVYGRRMCLNPFPIDEKEKQLFGIGDKCSYYWD